MQIQILIDKQCRSRSGSTLFAKAGYICIQQDQGYFFYLFYLQQDFTLVIFTQFAMQEKALKLNSDTEDPDQHAMCIQSEQGHHCQSIYSTVSGDSVSWQ